MPRGSRERARLAPSGHASVNEPRVQRQHGLGAEPQPLHHTGPEALNQGIGLCHHADNLRNLSLVLEVYRHCLTPAPDDTAHPWIRAPWPVDTDDVGSHVGEQHRSEGTRTNASHFDDAYAGERTGLSRRGGHIGSHSCILNDCV